MPPVVPFEHVRQALSSRGDDLMEIPALGHNSRQFWHPESMTSVLTDTGDGILPDGCVYSISAPLKPEVVAALRARADAPSLKQALRHHLLAADNEQRAHWAARRQPRDPADRANWWLHLLLLVKDDIVRERPQARPAATGLYLWAVDHAAQSGVFTPAEAAIQVSSFVAELRDRNVATDALPPADSIVEACLSQIPFLLDAIPDATDLRLLDLDTVRRSRKAKNLINAAAAHLDQVEEPHVKAQLAGWIAALPKLV
jgi:hypothetical protein